MIYYWLEVFVSYVGAQHPTDFALSQGRDRQLHPSHPVPFAQPFSFDVSACHCNAGYWTLPTLNLLPRHWNTTRVTHARRVLQRAAFPQPWPCEPSPARAIPAAALPYLSQDRSPSPLSRGIS